MKIPFKYSVTHARHPFIHFCCLPTKERILLLHFWFGLLSHNVISPYGLFTRANPLYFFLTTSFFLIIEELWQLTMNLDLGLIVYTYSPKEIEYFDSQVRYYLLSH